MFYAFDVEWRDVPARAPLRHCVFEVSLPTPTTVTYDFSLQLHVYDTLIKFIKYEPSFFVLRFIVENFNDTVNNR